MKKRIVSQTEYNGLIAKICRDIATSTWRPDYIVGISRGGLLPATMISHYFDIKMHTIEVGESNLWMAEDAYGYEEDPKKILIVDDINDTGRTLNWVVEDWPSGCLPANERWNNVWNNNVRFATVVDNLSSTAKVKIDYSGMEINKSEDDAWIEFPYEEWWAK
jgi:hypoxanthine phosphoribosyltransferase